MVLIFLGWVFNGLLIKEWLRNFGVCFCLNLLVGVDGYYGFFLKKKIKLLMLK